jgi:hypothetical protein
MEADDRVACDWGTVRDMSVTSAAAETTSEGAWGTTAAEAGGRVVLGVDNGAALMDCSCANGFVGCATDASSFFAAEMTGATVVVDGTGAAEVVDGTGATLGATGAGRCGCRAPEDEGTGGGGACVDLLARPDRGGLGACLIGTAPGGAGTAVADAGACGWAAADVADCTSDVGKGGMVGAGPGGKAAPLINALRRCESSCSSRRCEKGQHGGK